MGRGPGTGDRGRGTGDGEHGTRDTGHGARGMHHIPPAGHWTRPVILRVPSNGGLCQRCVYLKRKRAGADVAARRGTGGQRGKRTLSQSLCTSASDNCLQAMRFSIQLSRLPVEGGSTGAVMGCASGFMLTSSMFVSMVYAVWSMQLQDGGSGWWR